MNSARRCGGRSAPEPLSAMGAAYIDFALAKPGMFRLMFSPMLAARARCGTAVGRGRRSPAAPRRRAFATRRRARRIPAAAIAAWSLVHGLSHLILDGVLPVEAETFKQAIFVARRRATSVGAAAGMR